MVGVGKAMLCGVWLEIFVVARGERHFGAKKWTSPRPHPLLPHPTPLERRWVSIVHRAGNRDPFLAIDSWGLFLFLTCTIAPGKSFLLSVPLFSLLPFDDDDTGP